LYQTVTAHLYPHEVANSADDFNNPPSADEVSAFPPLLWAWWPQLLDSATRFTQLIDAVRDRLHGVLSGIFSWPDNNDDPWEESDSEEEEDENEDGEEEEEEEQKAPSTTAPPKTETHPNLIRRGNALCSTVPIEAGTELGAYYGALAGPSPAEALAPLAAVASASCESTAARWFDWIGELMSREAAKADEHRQDATADTAKLK
jgi:hypothetical protein